MRPLHRLTIVGLVERQAEHVRHAHLVAELALETEREKLTRRADLTNIRSARYLHDADANGDG
jgi:hypothetical protein